MAEYFQAKQINGSFILLLLVQKDTRWLKIFCEVFCLSTVKKRQNEAAWESGTIDNIQSPFWALNPKLLSLTYPPLFLATFTRQRTQIGLQTCAQYSVQNHRLVWGRR